MGFLSLGAARTYTVYAPEKVTSTNTLFYGRQLVNLNYTITFFLLANFSANLENFQRAIDKMGRVSKSNSLDTSMSDSFIT